MLLCFGYRHHITLVVFGLIHCMFWSTVHIMEPESQAVALDECTTVFKISVRVSLATRLDTVAMPLGYSSLAI